MGVFSSKCYQCDYSVVPDTEEEIEKELMLGSRKKELSIISLTIVRIFKTNPSLSESLLKLQSSMRGLLSRQKRMTTASTSTLDVFTPGRSFASNNFILVKVCNIVKIQCNKALD